MDHRVVIIEESWNARAELTSPLRMRIQPFLSRIFTSFMFYRENGLRSAVLYNSPRGWMGALAMSLVPGSNTSVSSGHSIRRRAREVNAEDGSDKTYNSQHGSNAVYVDHRVIIMKEE